MKKKLGMALLLFSLLVFTPTVIIPQGGWEEKYELLNDRISHYSRQKIFCLDLGEKYGFKMKDKSTRVVQLKAVKEIKDNVVHMMRRAMVEVEVNGKPLTLVCEPYALPVMFEGIRIMVDSTAGWKNIYKKAQFSVWDAGEPMFTDVDIGFPFKEYLLFSHEMQSHNQVIHVSAIDGEPAGQHAYHDYGIDFYGDEGTTYGYCPVDGTIYSFWEPEGKRCAVTVKDKFGLLWDVVHFVAMNPKLRVGAPIAKGQKIGLIGKDTYWSGGAPGLHLGIYINEDYLAKGDLGTPQLNLYPWMVYAYQREYERKLYAVARPHLVLVTGEKAVLNASHCISFDAPITSYKWNLPGGTVVNSQEAPVSFGKAGVYSAELWIKDAQGNEDVDFCKIKVYTANNMEPNIPILYLCHEPTLNVPSNTNVSFQVWLLSPQPATMPVTLDFGDGQQLNTTTSLSKITHAYAKPGIYAVSANTVYNGLSITQQQKVVIVN